MSEAVLDAVARQLREAMREGPLESFGVTAEEFQGVRAALEDRDCLWGMDEVGRLYRPSELWPCQRIMLFGVPLHIAEVEQRAADMGQNPPSDISRVERP